MSRPLTRHLLGLVLLAGCGQDARSPQDRSQLLPIPSLPELASLDAPVRQQLGERQQVVERLLADPAVAPELLSQAFGELGKVHHAYRKLQPARACYFNAHQLDPQAFSWAYYLGHVERGLGNIQASERAFEQALTLRPDDVPTLVWLAENALDRGHSPTATGRFEAALRADPTCARAELGLGRIALENGEPARAREHLEKVRRAQPEAQEVRYLLALAERELGAPENARSLLEGPASLGHLTRRSVALVDPLMRELGDLQDGAQAHEHRGLRAIARNNYLLAVSELRQALAIDPTRHDARHNLALSLLRLGKRQEAISELEALLAQAPDFSPSRKVLDELTEEDG